jgi:cephalosporin hydroxylase
MDSQALQVITNHVLSDVTYCGIPTRKNPLDAWIYQELIWKVKPDCVVEFGTFMGGSALMLLHMLQQVDNTPLVVTVDINECAGPHYTGILYLLGQACDLRTFDYIKHTVIGRRVMIVEDSSHEYQNTLNVLKWYCGLVPVDSYFIVEDTICHHGLDVGPNPGPYEAVQQFLSEDSSFVADKDCEKFGLTYNPNGFLRRVK